MSDVVDQITARLDEWHALAADATVMRYQADDYASALLGYDRDSTPAQDEFATAFDPAAVLRIVAGLRAVVALHDTDEDDPEPVCLNCTGGYHEREPWPCPTIEAIAAIWPDPDPRQAP